MSAALSVAVQHAFAMQKAQRSDWFRFPTRLPSVLEVFSHLSHGQPKHLTSSYHVVMISDVVEPNWATKCSASHQNLWQVAMVTALTLPPMPHFKSFTLRLCLLCASALLPPDSSNSHPRKPKTGKKIWSKRTVTWDILGPRSGSPRPGSTWFPVSYLLDLPWYTSQRTRKIVVHKHIISPKPLSSQWASLSGPSKLAGERILRIFMGFCSYMPNKPDRMGLSGSNSRKILRAGLKISSISSTADKSPLP